MEINNMLFSLRKKRWKLLRSAGEASINVVVVVVVAVVAVVTEQQLLILNVKKNLDKFVKVASFCVPKKMTDRISLEPPQQQKHNFSKILIEEKKYLFCQREREKKKRN
jgi:hypothetical protein